jgi:hypothetical protein
MSRDRAVRFGSAALDGSFNVFSEPIPKVVREFVFWIL